MHREISGYLGPIKSQKRGGGGGGGDCSLVHFFFPKIQSSQDAGTAYFLTCMYLKSRTASNSFASFGNLAICVILREGACLKYKMVK